jgi:hypothetical protein
MRTRNDREVCITKTSSFMKPLWRIGVPGMILAAVHQPRSIIESVDRAHDKNRLAARSKVISVVCENFFARLTTE